MYTDLQSVASPLGQPTAEAVHLRADDEARTRDLNLGKVALYQLSYVRLLPFGPSRAVLATSRTVADPPQAAKSGSATARTALASPTGHNRHHWPHLTRVNAMRAWLDGHLLDDPTTPALRVDDHGVTVGDGVFEAIKVVDGLPFALDRHLERLHRSAAGLASSRWMKRRCARGSRRCSLSHSPSAASASRSRAAGPHGIGSRRCEPHGHCDGRRDETMGRPHLGHHGAVAAQRARGVGGSQDDVVRRERRGSRRGAPPSATEAVFANTQGQLCEGTGTNVFYVIDGELRTSSLASGCLAGVTRGLILEWHGGREVDEPIEVLEEASEIFLASTTRDAQAVTRWNDRDLPHGPVTRAVQEVWRTREPELLGH